MSNETAETFPPLIRNLDEFAHVSDNFHASFEQFKKACEELAAFRFVWGDGKISDPIFSNLKTETPS